MRENKLPNEDQYQIQYINVLLERYRDKLLNQIIPYKNRLDDAELDLDEALFRWGLHYGKPVEQVSERCKEELVETSRLYLEVQRISKEVRRIDRESEISLKIQHYENMKKELIEKICDEQKCLPQHINITTGLIKIPDDFSLDILKQEHEALQNNPQNIN